MPGLDWHDGFNINVIQIDEQHRQLLDMAQSVHDALHAVSEPAVLLDKLDGLLAFTRQHFAFEESLMLKHAYPGIQEHCQEHTELLERVETLRQALASGQTLSHSANFDVSDDWVLAHVDGADRQLGLFLNQKEVF